MNRKAQELGMTNSHFVTPSGLHDEGHYSTARDMATLARYALKNPRFAAICRKTKAKLCFGNPPFDRWLSNHNRLLTDYEGCVGIKTGFTKKAGRCLVSAATRNGVTLVCVTLNDPNDWQDHKALFDYGFSVVKPVEIEPRLEGLSLRIVGGLTKTLPVRALDKTYACVTEQQKGELEQEVFLSPFYYAPVSEGDWVGQIIHYYKGFEVARTDLVAGESAAYDETPPKKTAWEKIKAFLERHLKWDRSH